MDYSLGYLIDRSCFMVSSDLSDLEAFVNNTADEYLYIDTEYSSTKDGIKLYVISMCTKSRGLIFKLEGGGPISDRSIFSRRFEGTTPVVFFDGRIELRIALDNYTTSNPCFFIDLQAVLSSNSETKISLKDLAIKNGYMIDKSEQRADWSGEISEEMLRYAIDDVRVMEWLSRGRLEGVIEELRERNKLLIEEMTISLTLSKTALRRVFSRCIFGYWSPGVILEWLIKESTNKGIPLNSVVLELYKIFDIMDLIPKGKMTEESSEDLYNRLMKVLCNYTGISCDTLMHLYYIWETDGGETFQGLVSL